MSVGVVTMLRTSGASVIWSLRLSWTVNCIESAFATSVRHMRNRTSSQSRKTSATLPKRFQAWNQVTVAAGSGGMLGRNVGGGDISRHDFAVQSVGSLEHTWSNKVGTAGETMYPVAWPRGVSTILKKPSEISTVL